VVPRVWYFKCGAETRLFVADKIHEPISFPRLSTCYAGKTVRSGLILGFGGADERKIKVAAQTLGKIIRELR